MSMMIIFSGNNISVRAYYDNGMNRIDAINELFYYLVLLTSFAFTLYNTNEGSRNYVGNLFNYLIGVMLLYNAGGMILGTIIRIYKKIQ